MAPRMGRVIGGGVTRYPLPLLDDAFPVAVVIWICLYPRGWGFRDLPSGPQESQGPHLRFAANQASSSAEGPQDAMLLGSPDVKGYLGYGALGLPSAMPGQCWGQRVGCGIGNQT